jgi:hypothetical protein
MEAVSTSETWAIFYLTTDPKLRNNCGQNLVVKSETEGKVSSVKVPVQIFKLKSLLYIRA